jgi:chromosome partitioning protein
MRGTLDNLKASLPLLMSKDAKELLDDVDRWLMKLEPIEYPCFGCKYCIPPEAMTLLTREFPELTSSTLSGCDFKVDAHSWPPVEGEYTVLDRSAKVAVSTLASVRLEEKLVKNSPPGLCIVGKTETENIGIDKIVKNVISNPSISHFIIAGKDPSGHKSGETLLFLWENGVDRNMRVIGSSGRRPVLKNVTRSDVAAFRKQVQVENMIGSENSRTIIRKIRDLYRADAAGKCSCPGDICSPQAQPVQMINMSASVSGPLSVVPPPTPLIKAKKRGKSVQLDKAGYFVILPSKKTGKILAEHYSYDNKLLRTIEGSNSRDVYFTIIENGWVTDLIHAAYLGKELARAELSIAKRFKFVQDGVGKTIAVANQKGGVGKTTTAINTTASLASSHKNVLLIDTDPQGNTTSGLGIDRDNLKGSLYDIFTGARGIEEVIQPTAFDNLQIVSSTIDLIGAELELAAKEGREGVLKKALVPVRDRYDYIFIDCPPSLSLLTLNALVAADSMLVPMQCEYYALEGIGSLLRTLDLIQNTFNPSLDIEGILLTMFDSRNTLTNQVSHDLRRYFGNKVYRTVIPRNVTLAEAPSHGKPVILYDIRSKGAISYLELAREIIENENGSG